MALYPQMSQMILGENTPDRTRAEGIAAGTPFQLVSRHEFLFETSALICDICGLSVLS
jgi:hypothetical protein